MADEPKKAEIAFVCPKKLLPDDVRQRLRCSLEIAVPDGHGIDESVSSRIPSAEISGREVLHRCSIVAPATTITCKSVVRRR
jgi:hypothetical protein